MNTVVFLVFFFVMRWTSGTPFSSGFMNVNNHPSGILRRFKINMQPKELVDECLDCQPLPTLSDLDVGRLTRLMGGALDQSLVSITKPKDYGSSKHFSFQKNREDVREFVINGTKEMKSFRGSLSKNQETFLVNWLQEMSSCPMKQVWRDMGPFSWPRFVKRAYCGSKRCSIVPTLKCTPSARRFFSLLRWFCLDAKRSHIQLYPRRIRQNVVKRNGFFCRWIKYNYPITTRCSCECES